MQLLHVLQVAFLCLASLGFSHDHHYSYPGLDYGQIPINRSISSMDSIPYSTRAYWMRQANTALGSPCPFAAFGTVIVNHTANDAGPGELVCAGANNRSSTGNPILHGEIVAINNCTQILTDPQGPYKLSPSEALNAFANLTLYTNAESCPMCASAIRWAGFKEYVYGTSIDTLTAKGWSQIQISSAEVFQKSSGLSPSGTLIAGVLTNETDPYFLWQYDAEYPCPKGCSRVEGSCEAN
ncbi:hypothetical protein M426DRAFT_323330 [Hypoxylon sp. CI-4A]|nr:hypothetical protein M426DRAFT_323330 [Hypoxylon sp. CI-4A]